jgi:hypothetical protein
MERDENLIYDRGYGRGDILYMAGGTIAAIGDALGHRWARNLDKNFWELAINNPEAVKARAEWLREAHKLIKEGDWKNFEGLLKEGKKVLPELNSGVFYLDNRSVKVYNLVAVIGNTTSPQGTYLDLVMHIDPMVRRMTDAWLAWKEGPREPTPLPFPDGGFNEAIRALKKGALEFLVENTYGPYDIPGIDRPNVTVKYTKEYEEWRAQSWAHLGRAPVPNPDNVERNIERLHYEHTTGTGRGEFSVSYGDGVYDFHFRVVRGGEYKGLTAVETHVRIVDKGLGDSEIRNALFHQITPLAEERHLIFAVDTLTDIGETMEKYAINVPYTITPAIEKIKTLAEILKEEYEVKFGRYPERGEYQL